MISSGRIHPVLRAMTLVGLLLAAMPTAAIASANANKSELVDHQKDKPLDVRSESGDIEIVRTPSETNKVRVRLSIKADTKERANQTKLDAQRDADGTLVVQVAWPGGERKPMESASIKVEIPDMSEVKAQTSNGSIKLTDTAGHALLSTGNGGITVRGHTGELGFESTNGKVEIRGVNGRVEGRGINGGVTLEQVSGSVGVETTNGAVNIRLTPDNKGPVNAKTTNGGISLTVGKAYAGNIKAQTANGEVRIELPGLIKSMKQEGLGGRTQTVELVTAGDETTLEASNADVTVRLTDEPASPAAPAAPTPGEKK